MYSFFVCTRRVISLALATPDGSIFCYVVMTMGNCLKLFTKVGNDETAFVKEPKKNVFKNSCANNNKVKKREEKIFNKMSLV